MQENDHYQLRVDLLKQMAALMATWDGTLESAGQLISENKKNMLQLKKLETQSAENLLVAYNETEETIIKGIIQQQEKMVYQIKIERESLLNRMKQINQKDKVISNYVSANRAPMFIDKGL